jgi:hypothetical protein
VENVHTDRFLAILSVIVQAAFSFQGMELVAMSVENQLVHGLTLSDHRPVLHQKPKILAEISRRLSAESSTAS